jgi:hypothetical protein
LAVPTLKSENLKWSLPKEEKQENETIQIDSTNKPGKQNESLPSIYKATW